MKKIVLLVLFMFLSSVGFAQCVGEIKDVRQDEVLGSIIVEAEFKWSGKVINAWGEICTLKDGKYYDSRNKECLGRSRYTDDTGTNAEIIAKAKDDVDRHCKVLISTITANQDFVNAEKIKQQKVKTSPIILDIKDDLIGEKVTKTEVIENYKGKAITVTYDSKNSTSNIIVSP